MRKPKDKEIVRCPVTNDEVIPSECWESRLPNGQSVVYGVIPLNHKHKVLSNFFGNYVEEPCNWAGIVAPQPVEVKK
jgi:hypothetical protein